MKTGRDYKFWFCTGSQDLYGEECLRKVAEHSAKIVEGLNASGRLPFEVVLKPTLIDPATIMRRCHYLDAYLFSRKDVDSGTEGIPQAAVPSAHPVQ